MKNITDALAPSVVGLFFALIPFIISMCIYRRRKCSIWTVIVAPLVGFWVYAILLVILFLLSGDV